jgi:ABC-type branched-subunit amino acid transport system substrate-binding protein
MKRYFCMLISLVLIILVVLTGCSNASTTTTTSTVTTTAASSGKAKVLTIGTIECLTGPVADILKLPAQGEKLAADYINAQGGININGQVYTIAVDQQDDQLSPDMAITATQSLLSKNIKFIVGTFPDFMVKSIDSVTEPAKVLYVSLNNSGGVGVLTANTKYQFLGATGSLTQIRASFAFLKETHPEIKTISFCQADDGQTPTVYPKIKQWAADNGFSMPYDAVTWTNDVVDFAPTVQKVMAQNADAIMIGNGPIQAYGSVLKIAREAGWKKLVFGIIVPCEGVAQVAGPAAATNFFSISFPNNAPGLPQITQDLIKMANVQWGKLDIMQVLGFNGIYCLVQAIQKAQSLDPTVVRDTWEKMDTIDTAFGTGSMGGMAEYGIKHAVFFPLPFSTLDNNKVSFAKWIDVSKSK